MVKRILIVSVALAGCLALAAGCGSAEPKKDTSGDMQAPAQATSAEATSADATSAEATSAEVASAEVASAAQAVDHAASDEQAATLEGQEEYSEEGSSPEEPTYYEESDDAGDEAQCVPDIILR